MSALEKVLRLSAKSEPEPDAIRSLAQAITLALTSACTTDDPREAARKTFAARKLSEELSGLLFTENMQPGPAEDRIAAAASQEHARTGVLEDLASGNGTVFFEGAAPPGDIPMHHAPFTGTHEHAHSVTMTHGHAHSHQQDSMHGGAVHGDNSGQKAWAAKGMSRRMEY